MRVAIYARNSRPPKGWAPKTPGEEPPGSWRLQVAKLQELSERAGDEVHLVEHDVASGKDSNRPGQERVMAAARGHHVHKVLVTKIDRWARSLQHLDRTVQELHELGVEFHAVDQGLVIRKKGDPTSRLILQILGAVAEWEGSIISERTRDSLAGAVGKGRHVRGCGARVPCPTGIHRGATE